MDTINNAPMAASNNDRAPGRKAADSLVVPGRVKLRRKKTPGKNVQDIVVEQRLDIDALLKEAIETMQIQPQTNEDIVRQLSSINVSAEDSFTAGSQLIKKKYEELQIPLPSSINVLSGENEPQEMEFPFSGGSAYGFATSGLKKNNGLYPENTNGIVLRENAGRFLTAVLFDQDKEGTEAAAVTNAASVIAANNLHLNEEENFPIRFDSLDEKIAPVKKDLGLEGQPLNGITARLDLKAYSLEVSGNSDKIHCLVIDPKSGEMESYNATKEQQYRESQIRNADWKKYRRIVESEISGEKQKKMLEKIDRIEAKGLTEEEKKTLMDRIELPKQITIGMPVEKGNIVVLANDKLIQALKAKAKFPGLVQMISEGVARGRNLQDICKEIMSIIQNKEAEYEIEEASRAMIAFAVP